MNLKYLLKPKNILQNIKPVNLYLMGICSLILVIISYLVAQEKIQDWDANLLIQIKEVLPSWFIYIAQIFYFLGEAEVTVFFVLFSLIYLVRRKYWAEAQVVAISCLSVLILIDQILKPFFKIRRPLDRLLPAITGYSYPSGHAAGNLLFYFLLAYIASQIKPQGKIYFYGMATIAIILMGVGSAYLRVHWISDIMASYCIGYLLFGIAVILLESSIHDRPQDR